MYDITILFDWIPGGQVEIFRSLIFKVNGQMNHWISGERRMTQGVLQTKKTVKYRTEKALARQPLVIDISISLWIIN